MEQREYYLSWEQNPKKKFHLPFFPTPPPATIPRMCRSSVHDTDPELARAWEAVLLQRLTLWNLAASVSFYADGVVIFCHPDMTELLVIFDLHMFFSQRGVAHQLCQGSHALA
jgi:hypothetical protein